MKSIKDYLYYQIAKDLPGSISCFSADSFSEDDDDEQSLISANMNNLGQPFGDISSNMAATATQMLSQRPTASDCNAWLSGIDTPATLPRQSFPDPKNPLYNGRHKFFRHTSPPASTMVATNHPLATPMAVPYNNSPGQGLELVGTAWSKFFSNPTHNFRDNHDTTYIEEHFPLSGVIIALESKTGKSIIVETTNQGYWLLPFDMSEARLIGLSWRTALDNMRSFPIRFEGIETIKATCAPECDEKMDMN